MKRTIWMLPTIALLLLAAGPTVRAEDGSSYRTGRIDPRVNRVPAEIQKGVFTEPDRFVKPLVQFLLKGAKDDYHKVKILHDWLAENIEYDVEAYLTGASVDNSRDAALMRRRAVCHGYAGLFEQMCSLAGIPCQRITGYGRGYGFSAGMNRNVKEENHAWNVVKIDGRWHLVDVTWNAGHVEQRKYKKEYATTYLFMDPRKFIFTHLPAEAKWQLLKSPISGEQFKKLPYLRPAFFDHGMSLVTPLYLVNKARHWVRFSVVVPEKTDVMVRLRTPDDTKLSRRTLIQRDGEKCRVLVIFPKPGRWKVQLYCKPLSQEGLMDMAVSLDFHSTAGTKKTFPKTYSTYDEMHACLLTPLLTPLATDEPVLFKIRVPKTDDVRLAIGDDPWQKLAPVPGEKDVYQLRAKVPADKRVRLNAREKDGSFSTLVDFSPAEKP